MPQDLLMAMVLNVRSVLVAPGTSRDGVFLCLSFLMLLAEVETCKVRCSTRAPACV